MCFLSELQLFKSLLMRLCVRACVWTGGCCAVGPACSRTNHGFVAVVGSRKTR